MTVAQNRQVVGRLMVGAVVAGLLALAGGCGTTLSSPATGVPAGVQAVGGGLQINWEAPTDGTVYLVDKTSGKLVVTESLSEGSKFEFTVDPESAEAFEKAVGVPPTKAQLVLYFKPAKTKS
jgi:hypothetical protein